MSDAALIIEEPIEAPVWNSERDDALRELYGQPINQVEIAAALSKLGRPITESGVKARVQALGLRRDPDVIKALRSKTHIFQSGPHGGWTDERIDLLKALVAEGLSSSQIATKLKITRNAVIGKVSRMGLSRSPEAVKVAQRLGNVAIRAPAPRPARAVSGPTPSVVRVSSDMRRLYQLPHSVPLEPARQIETGVEPKPWMERAFGECSWPVSGEGADTLSCCAPIAKGSWCKAHARIGYYPAKGWFSDKAMAEAAQKSRVG